MQLLAARIKDEEFLNEVNGYSDDQENFHLWWLGQSGYLLLWKGSRVLIDPYLSDSLTVKYANTAKPHIRMTERVIDPEMLYNISVVTSSHNHTDHLDGSTLIPIIKNNPGIKFIIPEANRQFVCERTHIPIDFPLGLNAGTSIREGAFTFHGIPACHNEIEKDELGQCRYMGYVIRFGRWTIYHSGDTLWFDEMVEILKPFSIDVALLPINGNDPSRGVAGNLDGIEAALLAKQVGARIVIPCHYNMFTFNTADPAAFIEESVKLGQPYKILPAGGHFSSSFFAHQ